MPPYCRTRQYPSKFESCCNPHCKGWWSLDVCSGLSPWWMIPPCRDSFKNKLGWSFVCTSKLRISDLIHLKYLHGGLFLLTLLYMLTSEDCSYFMTDKALCIILDASYVYYKPKQWHMLAKRVWAMFKNNATATHIPSQWYCSPHLTTLMMSIMIIQFSSQTETREEKQRKTLVNTTCRYHKQTRQQRLLRHTNPTVPKPQRLLRSLWKPSHRIFQIIFWAMVHTYTHRPRPCSKRRSLNTKQLVVSGADYVSAPSDLDLTWLPQAHNKTLHELMMTMCLGNVSLVLL